MSWDRDEEQGDWGEDEDSAPCIPCPYCGAEMLEDAPQCPACGRYLSEEDRPARGKLGWVATGVVVLLIVALALAALR